MNRRGELSEEVFGLVIAIVGVIIIFFVMLAFYNSYDEVRDASKSYFGALEVAIGIADEGGAGEFYLVDLVKSEGDRVNFYLVYFGNRTIVEYEEDFEGINFTREEIGDNALCVCSWGKRGRCADCLNLDFPAVAQNGDDAQGWVLKDRFNIKKRGDEYVFER